MGQLEFIFALNYENRTFFIFFAIAAILSTILGIAFWFPRAASTPLATWLAIIAALFFAIALWQFDASLILGFGLGCAFALWSRFAPTVVSSANSAIESAAVHDHSGAIDPSTTSEPND